MYRLKIALGCNRYPLSRIFLLTTLPDLMDKKTSFLLLLLGALAGQAHAQTTPAAKPPPLGITGRSAAQAAPRYQHPQPNLYQAGPAMARSSNSSSYQTSPHAMRIVVPDTTDRRMPRLQVPAPAPDDRGVVPLPPQQRVRE